jgi:hypothetical protein
LISKIFLIQQLEYDGNATREDEEEEEEEEEVAPCRVK